MKANEFVKKFGWGKSKMAVKKLLPMEDGMPVFDYNSEDLKRLIESHELVMWCGGLEIAKQNQLFLKAHELSKDGDHVDKAIADVESCL